MVDHTVSRFDTGLVVLGYLSGAIGLLISLVGALAAVVLAAGIDGVSNIDGAARLEHKESHRGLTLQEEFGKLGLRIELDEDTMLVYGTGRLKGGVPVFAHDDHRIAMALGISSLLINSEIRLKGHEAVSKSYPQFWDHLESVTV